MLEFCDMRDTRPSGKYELVISLKARAGFRCPLADPWTAGSRREHEPSASMMRCGPTSDATEAIKCVERLNRQANSTSREVTLSYLCSLGHVFYGIFICQDLGMRWGVRQCYWKRWWRLKAVDTSERFCHWPEIYNYKAKVSLPIGMYVIHISREPFIQSTSHLADLLPRTRWSAVLNLKQQTPLRAARGVWLHGSAGWSSHVISKGGSRCKQNRDC